ncbi:hypothetical protein HMPREF0401_01142 [Fusobacterium animalis 11_3_2]|uniref:Uncharacterized protein n=1 Tax=Fusobacterium animalis 11_3_2 TaxID=457403 RepID=F7KZX1_9FUSO|nr:hypothetical protein [Fusobacterium animalis]EGN67126.1 hypothetical protein HMPREF0401_01142 [Fusobacterium animalis 11_3_2]
MVKKFRELKKKKDFIKFSKGALRLMVVDFILLSCKRIDSNNGKLKGSLLSDENSKIEFFVGEIKTKKGYLYIKSLSKKRKRNGKNKMKGNQYLYQCNCGHQFISNKKWNNGEIYCPETDCKTCIEKRIK